MKSSPSLDSARGCPRSPVDADRRETYTLFAAPVADLHRTGCALSTGPHGACHDREFSQRHGDFERLMADSQKKRKSRTQRALQPRAKEPASTAERVSDLAWAGQHAQAIELATAALATPG